MTVTRSTRAAFAAVRASKRSAIEAIADNQRRMIVTAQLCACGLTTSDIRGRVLSGTLREALRNLYLVGTNVFDEPRFRLGACLSYGGDAALTARASLDGWNFTRFTRRQRDTPLEIVTRTARRRRIDGVQLLRSSRFTSDHRVWHDGEWLASVLWTITDLGRSLTPYQIANVIHEAVFHHDVSLTDIEDLLTLRGPFPGARNVRRAIAIVRSGSAGTRSFSEDRFIELAAMVTSR